MEQTEHIPENLGTDLASYNGTVLDISDSTRDFFLKRHPAATRKIIIITVLLEIPCLLLIFLGLPILLAPLLLPLSIYLWVRTHMKQLFFTQLASALGMQYALDTERNTVSGYFFNVGSRGALSNVLAGTYNGVPIRLYEYQFTTGSGKHKQSHPFVVSEIDTKGKLPHVFVKPDGFGVFWKPSGSKHLSLEGNFNDHFDVYVPEDSEIEALQILEPDVMARLIDEFNVFGFECHGTKTYVFKPGSFADNRDSLIAHIKLLERLYDELIPELQQLVRS